MPYTRFDKYDLIVGNALSDNDCGFNAAALALCIKQTLDQMEQHFHDLGQDPNQVLKKFIELSAKQLAIDSNWAAVKAQLIILRALNPRKLQQLLAPIMRQIATSNPGSLKESLRFFQAAFYIYVYKNLKLKISGPEDDIYLSHPFISNKFRKKLELLNAEVLNKTFFPLDRDSYNQIIQCPAEFRSETDKQKIKEFDAQMEKCIQPYLTRLIDWWKKSGFFSFFRRMSNLKVWVGDIELARLGQYFGVNVDVYNGKFKYGVHFANGHIDRESKDFNYRLSVEEIKQLITRRVVDRPPVNDKGEFTDNSPLLLLPLSEKKLMSRLKQVPDFETIHGYIEQHKTNLKQATIPKNWSQESLQELAIRDVIDGEFTKFLVSGKAALKRIKALPQHEALAQAWQKKYRKAPSVTLTNPKDHWDYVVKNKKSLSKSQSDSALNTLDANKVTVCKLELHQQILEKYSIWANQPSVKENSWEKLIAEQRSKKQNIENLINQADALKNTESNQKTNLIDYTIDEQAKEVIQVTEEEQVKLDGALAEKLQIEECRRFTRGS